MPVIETEDGTLLDDPQVCVALVASSADESSFDPTTVTDVLGLNPTRTLRVGQALPHGRSSQHALWARRVFPRQVAFEADDVVSAALAPLAGKEAAVATLRDGGVRLQLTLVVRAQVACDSAGDPTVHDMYLGLSAQSIARLAELSMAYAIDQQFWAPSEV